MRGHIKKKRLQQLLTILSGYGLWGLNRCRAVKSDDLLHTYIAVSWLHRFCAILAYVDQS